ncbi:MAG: DUF3052 family protein [Blastocatellia bacterium]|nr:DUF3052 family protein [Blastocatellia bacterium]
MTVGYSGTPLAKKLGIKEGMTVLVVNAPANYAELVAPLPEGVVVCDEEQAGSLRSVAVAHLFTSCRDELAAELSRLRNVIAQDGAIWVSWYKKAAKLPTEITEDDIRDAAFSLGLVDVKVCAVDEKWSGLKVVIRKENRAS